MSFLCFIECVISLGEFHGGERTVCCYFQYYYYLLHLCLPFQTRPHEVLMVC